MEKIRKTKQIRKCKERIKILECSSKSDLSILYVKYLFSKTYLHEIS
jgi:hypothetical protein